MRYPWLVLLVLFLLGGAGWFASPHLKAWYHWRAGRSALESYHNQTAADHLEACLQVWPTSGSTHLLACRAARRIGAFDMARQHLEECRRLEGDLSPTTSLEEDLLDASMGNLENVEASLETRAEQEPEEAPLIWEALASGYLRMYRIRDALTCLKRWLHVQPDNAQALYLRADVWRHVRSPGKAAPDFRRVVELDPERHDARQWLAYCLIEIGVFDEALVHLEFLRRRYPDDLELAVRFARCRSKLGQKALACRILADVLAKQSDHGLALRTRGQLALMEEKPNEAEGWLQRAVEALPHDYEANYALFLALSRQGKKPAARAQSKTVEKLKKRLERLGTIQSHEMTLKPRDPALSCELGTLLLQVGYPEVGRRWLYRALFLDPNYGLAHLTLAHYYARHGDREQATYHRQQAARSMPR